MVTGREINAQKFAAKSGRLQPSYGQPLVLYIHFQIDFQSIPAAPSGYLAPTNQLNLTLVNISGFGRIV